MDTTISLTAIDGASLHQVHATLPQLVFHVNDEAPSVSQACEVSPTFLPLSSVKVNPQVHKFIHIIVSDL